MVSHIYLHGFASSPQSAKARELSDRFREVHLNLRVPDLNQESFTDLTISRQIRQVEALFPPQPESVILIGSSLGGLTAAWLGDRHPQVERLVLLAPAFGFLDHWLPRLGDAQMQQWQQDGFLPVFHYREQQKLPLAYQFVTDATPYSHTAPQRPLPTLILHGIHDDVIPVQASRDYCQNRPWVKLIELESDHALGNVSEEIWAAIAHFLQL